jgi:hypothetical protein
MSQDLKTKLEKWAEDTSLGDGDSTIDAADWHGRQEMLNLLWPVIEAMESCVVGDDAERPEIYALRVNLTLNKALVELERAL